MHQQIASGLLLLLFLLSFIPVTYVRYSTNALLCNAIQCSLGEYNVHYHCLAFNTLGIIKVPSGLLMCACNNYLLMVSACPGCIRVSWLYSRVLVVSACPGCIRVSWLYSRVLVADSTTPGYGNAWSTYPSSSISPFVGTTSSAGECIQ